MAARKQAVPRHVGIIMDGNRRYAKQKGMLSWMGHEHGAKTLFQTMEWARDLGVKELTFYAFSAENFRRSKEEFDNMMKLFIRLGEEILLKLKKVVKKARQMARILFVGILDRFPLHVQHMMQKIMDATKHYKDYVVNIAVGYGGRGELIRAFQMLYHKAKVGQVSVDQLTEEDISKELYVTSDPEMIIRTGGTRRLSNFLIWQSSYSELFFLDKLWPEFTKEDLAACIHDYMTHVNRNFGR